MCIYFPHSVYYHRIIIWLFVDTKQIIALMGLNLFSLLFGFSALLANSLVPATPSTLSSYQQVVLRPTHINPYLILLLHICDSVLIWQKPHHSLFFSPSFEQQAGSYVTNASSIVFNVLCFLGSVYILFLSCRGLRRYSSPHIQVYSSISQVQTLPQVID